MTGQAEGRSDAYASHLQFYQDVYGHAVKEVRPAGSVGASVFMAEQEAGDWSDAATPDLIIGVLMRGPVRLSGYAEGRYSGRFGPGAIFVQPPFFETTVIAEDKHAFRILSVPHARLLELVSERSDCIHHDIFRNLRLSLDSNRHITAIIDRLWAEGRTGSPHGALLADGLFVQLAAELLRLKDGHRLETQHTADWRVRRAIEYLEARLADDVGLDELAVEVGLSARHLTSAFRAATGLPPHRWLMRRRVERACKLLGDKRQNITEIALECGFSSSQHFATAFRQQMSTTPSAYRRERQS